MTNIKRFIEGEAWGYVEAHSIQNYEALDSVLNNKEGIETDFLLAYTEGYICVEGKDETEHKDILWEKENSKERAGINKGS